MSELTYTLKNERNERSIEVKAEPNEFGSEVRAEYTFRHWVASDPPSVEVHWSCGGRRYDIEDARKFFKAGLAACDQLEKLIKKHEGIEARKARGKR